MSVNFNTLPEWAKRAIHKAGKEWTTQINREGHALSVKDGVAYFDGQRVLKDNEVTPQEETVRIKDLPGWARKTIGATSKDAQVQKMRGEDTLQINGGVAFFNGKRVVR